MMKWLALLSVCTCLYFPLSGQKKTFLQKAGGWLESENDTTYIEEHTKDITARLFGSRKYNYYDIVDNRNGKDQEVLYRPNTPFNVGFGFNYRFIGINIAFNLPVINKQDKYGETKFLDLQSHLYTRRLVLDFYGQFYRGYYIANTNTLFGTPAATGPVMLRPDVKNMNLGLNVQYVFNSKRFSYRAAYLQNDYQKKSAGSLLIGGEIFGFRMKGDSSLIPSNIPKENFFNDVKFYRTRIISTAANAGYAYTFVYKKHFFATVSLSGSLGVNHTIMQLTGGGELRKTGIQFNNTVRASIGYNSSRYFAGIHYVDMTTRSGSPVENTYQAMGAGNFRISLVRRFTLKKQLF